jgi:hypothetical protein
MKPAEWIAILPAINNGWAFAAFIIVIGISVYFNRRDAP